MQAFDRLIPMDSGVKAGSASQPNQMPSWLVKILDYTESGVEGYKDHSILRGFYAKTSRSTSMAGKTDALLSNTLRHSHVVLCIPRGNLQTKLESHIYASNPISQITIINIAVMNGVIGKLQEIEYQQCYVQQIEPALDWLLVELKITKYSNTLFKYTTDGRLLGKDMAEMDYTLNPKIDVNIYQADSIEDADDQSELDEEVNDDSSLSSVDSSGQSGDDQESDLADEDEEAGDDGDDVNNQSAANNAMQNSNDDEDAMKEAQEDSAVVAVKALVGDDQQAVDNASHGIFYDAKSRATYKLKSMFKNALHGEKTQSEQEIENSLMGADTLGG